jgi:hypothetical protein
MREGVHRLRPFHSRKLPIKQWSEASPPVAPRLVIALLRVWMHYLKGSKGCVKINSGAIGPGNLESGAR